MVEVAEHPPPPGGPKPLGAATPPWRCVETGKQAARPLSPADFDPVELWDDTMIARYFCIAALAAAAIALPQVGPHHVLIGAALMVIGLPYNLLLHRLYRINRRPPWFLPFADVAVCLCLLPVAPLTFVPSLLVMMSVIALAATGLNRRVATMASVFAVVGLVGLALVLDIPNATIGITSFGIGAGMIVVTVGAVSSSERRLRAKFSSLVEGLDAIVWERDPATMNYTYVSSKADVVLGYPRRAWLEDGFWFDHIHPDDRSVGAMECRGTPWRSHDHQQDYRMRASDGRVVHLHDLITVTCDAIGRPISSQGATIDVTERKRVEERVTQYADIVESIDLGLTVLRLEDDDPPSLRLVAANPAASAALKWPLDRYIGERLLDAAPWMADHRVARALAEVVRTGSPVELGDVVLPRPKGADETIIALSAFPLPGRSVCVSLHDVTDTALASRALRRQALHDGLTGLPNRSQLNDRLRVALRHAGESGEGVALLLMDLDQFKEVNDALGHHLGDQVLVALSRRLEKLMGPTDVIARLGGDEFAIVLTREVTERTACDMAERIELALQAPFRIDELRLQTKASIGIAIFPEHGGDAETLTQRADVAMYMAKRSGGGHAFYRAELDRSSVRRLALLGDLRRAIDQEEMVLHLQPLVDLRTGRTVRAEALVRWQHAEHGLLQPSEFVELAGLSGFIQPLTRWVLRRSIEMATGWRDRGHMVGLAVNLSVRNLYDPELPRYLAEVLADTGFPATELTLELTETELMDDPVLALEVLNELGRLGVGTAVDDFGTGYSSLTYLKDLPIREIKIDRSFVADMRRRPDEFTIVRSMVELGHNLGLQVVAEGVEHEADLISLGMLGCDLAQGFHISPPLSLAAFEIWLSEHEVWPVVALAELPHRM